MVGIHRRRSRRLRGCRNIPGSQDQGRECKRRRCVSFLLCLEGLGGSDSGGGDGRGGHERSRFGIASRDGLAEGVGGSCCVGCAGTNAGYLGEDRHGACCAAKLSGVALALEALAVEATTVGKHWVGGDVSAEAFSACDSQYRVNSNENASLPRFATPNIVWFVHV